MKKLVSIILALGTMAALNAQEYLQINSHWHGAIIPVENIDSITVGELSHTDKLPAIMAQDENISLFNEALQLTHLCDSLVGDYNYNFWCEQEDSYLFPSIYGNALAPAPTKIRLGYTAFVETDAVFAAHGINNIADLKAYAAKVYDEMYPEDAAISDPTDRRHSLNRFISYHLLDRMGRKENLTVAGVYNERAGAVKEKYDRSKVDIADWYETLMPHSLMKCSSPLLPTGAPLFINRRGLQENAEVKGVEIVNTDGRAYQGIASNGYYHYIDGIIAYDKQTQQVVLDEQILVHNSTMSPEFMNNDMRINNPFGYTTSDAEILIPRGAMKNITINNDETRLYYLFNKGWTNAQTDEMLILGAYDVTFKLPPLPAGTYELNLGYTANSMRGVAEFYLNEELCGTVDMRISSDDPRIGWIADADLGTPEAIAENDSLLFMNGYRKGLDYCYTYNVQETHRDRNQSLRRIITTFTTDGKTDYYLRIKNANEFEDGSSQTYIDYFELCPTHLLKEYK